MQDLCRLSAVTLFLLLALSALLINQQCASAQTSQGEMKLSEACNAVEKAFNAVYNAEKAGANITYLLAQLNNAVRLLAQAENSYRSGDLDNAVVEADSIIAIASETTNLAMDAKQEALVSSKNDYLVTVIITAIGSIVFILVMLIFWRLFKRSYFDRLQMSKPTVGD